MIRVIAIVMLRSPARATAAGQPMVPCWWRVLLGGVVVGFLTGFLEVGGGFLIVPALVLLLGMDMRGWLVAGGDRAQ